MEFRVLGPLEVRRDGRPVTLGGSKQRTLLAILLLEANHIVSSDRLIDALWGGQAPATAAKALHVHVSQLRKSLVPDRPPGAPNSLVVTAAPGYVLRVEPDQLDLNRFQRFRIEARRALEAGDPATAAAALRRGLGLWRGPALADLAFEPFAGPEIARLEELRLATVEERIEADLALGRHAELVGELETLVDAHPLRERLRAQLMLALYRSGRQAEALDVYQAARHVLVDELGIDPSPDLQRLEVAILRHDPALETSRTPHGGDAEIIRGRRAAGLFVGREAELMELRAGLEDALGGRGRLFLLAGEPGIGKTRLADELASEAKAHGALVFWGRSWGSGDAPPYWPWTQALRPYVLACEPELLRAQLGRGATELAALLPELPDLCPDLPPRAGAEPQPFRLYGATAGFLRRVSAMQPVVVVLDDLHTADAATLLLLQFVTSELADMRVLAVGAYRASTGEAAAAVAELARLATGHLMLRGLAVADVETLLESRAGRRPASGTAEAVRDATGGNPAALGELVRRLLAEDRLDPAGVTEP